MKGECRERTICTKMPTTQGKAGDLILHLPAFTKSLNEKWKKPNKLEGNVNTEKKIIYIESYKRKQKIRSKISSVICGRQIQTDLLLFID